MKKKKKHIQKKNPIIKFLDKIIFVVAIAGPLTNFPQLSLIWKDKKIEGVSIYTWIGYVTISSIWLGYGFVHKDRAIIISNILWITIGGLVIFGIRILG